MTIVIFILVLSLMVFVHELGHFIMAKRAGVKVEEFGFGYPPRLFAIKRGETEYSINIIPLGGFTKMLGEEDPSDPRSFARAKKRWRTIILVAGSMMNIFLAALLFAGSFMAGSPEPVQTQTRISFIVPGSPAETAGLKPGDVLVNFAGNDITTAKQIRPLAETYKGQEVTIEVQRDGNLIPLTIVPRATWPSGEGPLGIAAVDYPTKMEAVSHPFLESLVMGIRQTVSVIVFTLYVPIMILRGALPLELARPVGPIGIYQITSQAATESVNTGWLFPLLNVSGLLSASLGVANLLPIPGLDGGRLVFVILEAVRRKRVSPEREGFVHLVGLAVLVSLVLVISYFDLLSPVPNIDWGVK
ncbi:MAG: M50 family metallopeptidase [Chloroflexi bacterium]|nr:M50 family metallopeptidase [Chloroflexota bacterium]